jgi:hypothetical protein
MIQLDLQALMQQQMPFTLNEAHQYHHHLPLLAVNGHHHSHLAFKPTFLTPRPAVFHNQVISNHCHLQLHLYEPLLV